MKINWKATKKPLWQKILVFVYVLPVLFGEMGKKPKAMALIVQFIVSYFVFGVSQFLALPFIVWFSISSVLFFLKK